MSKKNIVYNDENDYELLYLVEEENEEAKEIFFEKYKPMVEMMAKKYYSQVNSSGYELNDFIQEGMMGLSQAINDYKNEKNIKFVTFANVCVKRQILSFIRDINRQKHQILNNSLSIEQENNSGRNLLSILNDGSTINPEESFILDEEQTLLKDKIKVHLTDREKEVFDLRFDGFTYQEIALLLNISVKSVDGAMTRIKQKINNMKKDID